jgi:peptide/nickel transport system permease protein
MWTYVVRRIVAMVGLLVALSIAVFLMFTALPTNPAALTCGKTCTPQVVHANEVRLGYDKPLAEQYGDFVKGIFVGRDYGTGSAEFHCDAPCLGYSFSRGEDVTSLIESALPVTATEAVGACVLWRLAGTGIGIMAALTRGRWADRLAMGGALVGYSFPTFFIGLVLLYLVVFKFQLMPYPSYTPLSQDPAAWLRSFILPWLTLAAVYAAFYARLTRNLMLDTLHEDFIRTARSKGVSESKVIGRHAVRASMSPVITAAGLDLGQLLGGVVLTETIFGLPGLGKLTLDSVTSSDLPITTAVVLVAGFFVVAANLVVDLLYGVIDPRVRLA